MGDASAAMIQKRHAVLMHQAHRVLELEQKAVDRSEMIREMQLKASMRRTLKNEMRPTVQYAPVRVTGRLSAELTPEESVMEMRREKAEYETAQRAYRRELAQEEMAKMEEEEEAAWREQERAAAMHRRRLQEARLLRTVRRDEQRAIRAREEEFESKNKALQGRLDMKHQAWLRALEEKQGSKDAQVRQAQQRKAEGDSAMRARIKAEARNRMQKLEQTIAKRDEARAARARERKEREEARVALATQRIAAEEAKREAALERLRQEKEAKGANMQEILENQRLARLEHERAIKAQQRETERERQRKITLAATRREQRNAELLGRYQEKMKLMAEREAAEREKQLQATEARRQDIMYQEKLKEELEKKIVGSKYSSEVQVNLESSGKVRLPKKGDPDFNRKVGLTKYKTCPLCEREFSTDNLPGVTTHAGIVRVREELSKKTGVDIPVWAAKFKSIGARSDTVNVCAFCSQFFFQ